MTDWSKYKAFMAEADKDQRVGRHTFMVTEKRVVEWGGGKFLAIKGDLLTAGKAQADFTLPEHDPTEEEMAQAKAEGKTRGLGLSLNLLYSLDKHYGKDRDSLSVGDELAVETYADKKGFIRVNRIVDAKLAAAQAKSEAKAASDIPF